MAVPKKKVRRRINLNKTLKTKVYGYGEKEIIIRHHIGKRIKMQLA